MMILEVYAAGQRSCMVYPDMHRHDFERQTSILDCLVVAVEVEVMIVLRVLSHYHIPSRLDEAAARNVVGS